VFQQLVVDPKGAEAIAALHALIFCKEVEFFDIILEGDALQIVTEVKSNISSKHGSGHFIEAIQVELGTFRSSSIVHIRREANSTAHILTRNAATNFVDLLWLEDIPNSIFDTVLREVVVPKS
jgi:ribonuclease HI